MADAPPLVDGFTTLEGGMDSGRDPELIGPNQVALLINATVRGGRPKSRPGFRQPRIGFDNSQTQAWFKQNRIQGAGYFNIDSNSPVTVASVGGKIFEHRMSSKDAYLHDITPVYPPNTLDASGNDVSGQVDRNSNRQPKTWMQQADTYFVIQDNLGKPIIYDGAKTRRATDTEVPVGSCMAYGLGRLVVGNGNQFLVGDIKGGPTSVVSFTETTFLAGGGALTLLAEMGNITGMIFTAKQDTSTGQGTLLVFAENGVASVDLSGPRENWQSMMIQQVALIDIGATSHQSLALINGDVFFRAKDGIRSYRDSRAQQEGWNRTPISYEVDSILSNDTPWLLDQVNGVYFDNRYLMTVSPKPNAQGAIFRGLAVMDFVPVTSTRNPAPPCFDGLWTGIQPVALVVWKYKKGNRCFAFCTDDVAGNQIWEITTSAPFDNDTMPIESSLVTRSLRFNPNPYFTTMADQGVYKSLQDGMLWVAGMRGPVQFKMSFRPDQYPFWADWIEFKVGSPSQTCGEVPICSPIPMLPDQYRPALQLPKVPDTCNPGGARELLRCGFTFQIQIKWIGCATLTRLLLTAKTEQLKKQECIGGSPYLYPECAPLPSTYYSFPVSASCPNGTTGGPFALPYAAFSSTVSQDDANAKAQAQLETLIATCQAIPPPVVASGSVSVLPSTELTPYQIVATNNPTSYGATNLPAGLSLNTSTGLITGTVTDPDPKTYSVGISATNDSGTGTGTLEINVKRIYTFNFNSDQWLASWSRTVPQVFEVSIDGGAYQSASLNTNYSASSQFKFRLTATPGTYDAGDIDGNYDGSILCVSGNMTTNDSNLNILNGSATLHADASYTALSQAVIAQIGTTHGTGGITNDKFGFETGNRDHDAPPLDVNYQEPDPITEWSGGTPGVFPVGIFCGCSSRNGGDVTVNNVTGEVIFNLG